MSKALISRDHAERVRGYIRLGETEGARLVCGGAGIPELAPSPNKLDVEAFVLPTVFTECQDDMTIVQDEIFGPVMSVLDFETEDEVISRANDTDFGLAAGVMSRNLARAHRVVTSLEAGTCWINNYNLTPIEMPFGGYKASGFGRENGLGWRSKVIPKIKSIYVELGDVESPY